MAQVLPRGMGPPKAAGWQVFASILLLLLTLASTVRRPSWRQSPEPPPLLVTPVAAL